MTLEEKFEELERKVKALEIEIISLKGYYTARNLYYKDCGCPPSTVCQNAACPRRPPISW